MNIDRDYVLARYREMWDGVSAQNDRGRDPAIQFLMASDRALRRQGRTGAAPGQHSGPSSTWFVVAYGKFKL